MILDDIRRKDTLQKVVLDVRRLMGEGLRTAPRSPGDVLDKVAGMGAGMANAVDRAVARATEPPRVRTSNTLYISELGNTCMRQLWYRVNAPEMDTPLSYHNRIKFLYGDILEELVLGLVELSGHKVTGRQQEIRQPIGDYNISGRIDAFIDGILVDVKSASAFGFEKFRDHGLTVANDAFGYLAQLDTYRLHTTDEGLGAGFLAIHRDLGHITSDYYEVNELPIKTHTMLNDLVPAIGGHVFNDTVPFGRFDPVPEGSSGNLKLATKCSYCCTPETLLLTNDLTWKRADEFIVGGGVAGFDEALPKHTQFQRGSVVSRSLVDLDCIEIVTDLGNITVSRDHKFVTKTKGGYVRKWREAGELSAGHQIAFFHKPWQEDATRDGGWLAGFLDGEAHWGKHYLSWSQLPGTVADMATALFNKENAKFSSMRTGKKSACITHRILGGAFQSYGLIGKYRPIRLLPKALETFFTACIHSKKTKYATILGVREAGIKTVVALETTTKTYISNGFLSHNCGFKNACWADANDGKGLRAFNYSKGPVWFTKVAREPKVDEVK